MDCPKLGPDEGAVCPKVGALPEEAPVLPCPPKTPPEPNAGADFPKAGAAAVLLLDPKLKGVDVLLGDAPLLPPKLKVELVTGAAAGACAGLLALKPKLGVLEAPKPKVGDLAGADPALLCPKAKVDVLAGAGAEWVVWLAPKAGTVLLVAFGAAPKPKVGVLLGAKPAALLGCEPPKAKPEDDAGVDASPVAAELLPKAKGAMLAVVAAAAGWLCPNAKEVLLRVAAGMGFAALLWLNAKFGVDAVAAAGGWVDPSAKGAAGAELIDGVRLGAAVLVLPRPKRGVEAGTGAEAGAPLDGADVDMVDAPAASVCLPSSPEREPKPDG